jgi:ABC-type multidrug transport system fused ATPase/permease subunit
MPNKDLTEVGENGINMSPGQQHRLSLARAAYSRSEIVLLDSTLNAVDNTVQANIVKKCIIEFLKEQENRTVLLVTHSLQSLKYADLIIVLDEGRIARRATSWTDIKDEWNTIENADEVEDTEQITEEASVEETIIDSVSPSEPKTDGKIVEKEDRESGSISLSVVKSYFMGYGIPLFLLSLFTGLLAKLGQQSQSIWFAEWSRHKEDKSSFYILIYISLGAVGLLFVFLKSLFFALGNLRSANVLHDKMLRRVLLARMHFFDSNPIGRILNRFTSDQFTVDYSLLFTFSTLYSELINATGVLLVISYVTPMFLILIVPLAIGYYFIQEFYRATSREMRRLESVSRSPLISHVAACIRGTSTIRAYACQSLVFAQNAIRANYFGKHFTVRWNLNRWLGVRVEGIGAMIVFGSAIFAVMRRSTLDPALVGLSISFALQVTQK